MNVVQCCADDFEEGAGLGAFDFDGDGAVFVVCADDRGGSVAF